jgi:hypothetical protein
LISRTTRFTEIRASITELHASGIQQGFSVLLISRIKRSTSGEPPTAAVAVVVVAAAATTTTTITTTTTKLGCVLMTSTHRDGD